MTELSPQENSGSRPTRITVALGRKVSDGDYGSTEVHFGIELDVPPGKRVGDFIDETFSRVHKKLIDTLIEQKIIEG